MMRAGGLLLLVVVCIGVAAVGAELSGTWVTNLTLDPQEAAFSAAVSMTSTVDVSLGIGGWVFGSTTTLAASGWTDQAFKATGVLGAIGVSSSVNLDPAGTFDSATLTTDMSIAGVRYVSTFASTPNDLAATITASAASEFVSIDVSLRLGDTTVPGCDLFFQGVTIGVDFSFCCAAVNSDINFTCNGFTDAKFGVNAIAIPGLPWMTLGVQLQFGVQTDYEKKITITPSFNFGTSACFDIYFEVDEDSAEAYPPNILSISTIRVVGIGLECEIGGVSFAAVSYWGTGAPPAPLTGEYWEAYQISTTDDSACCGPFGFDFAVFFQDGAATLFEAAFFQAEFSLDIGSAFSVTVGVDLDANAGFTELRLGLTVEF